MFYEEGRVLLTNQAYLSDQCIYAQILVTPSFSVFEYCTTNPRPDHSGSHRLLHEIYHSPKLFYTLDHLQIYSLCTDQGATISRPLAWTVPLAGAGLTTDGVVLCNQVRTVDWKARHAVFIESVGPELVADVLARVATLID